VAHGKFQRRLLAGRKRFDGMEAPGFGTDRAGAQLRFAKERHVGKEPRYRRGHADALGPLRPVDRRHRGLEHPGVHRRHGRAGKGCTGREEAVPARPEAAGAPRQALHHRGPPGQSREHMLVKKRGAPHGGAQQLDFLAVREHDRHGIGRREHSTPRLVGGFKKKAAAFLFFP
jgi:hypothetical protein